MTDRQYVAVVGTNSLADALRKQLSPVNGVEVLDLQEAKTRSIPLHIVIETSNLELAEKKKPGFRAWKNTLPAIR